VAAGDPPARIGDEYLHSVVTSRHADFADDW